MQNPPPPPRDLRSEGWEPRDDSGFIALVGPMWQCREGEGWRYGFLAEPKHHNLRGVVQGGMLMTFADRAMGMTGRAATGNKPQATIQLDVHFIDAVQVGEFVEARCHVVRRTASVLFIEGTFAVGPRVVATAKGVWKILRAREPTRAE